jgi:hypothetical protein
MRKKISFNERSYAHYQRYPHVWWAMSIIVIPLVIIGAVFMTARWWS